MLGSNTLFTYPLPGLLAMYKIMSSEIQSEYISILNTYM